MEPRFYSVAAYEDEIKKQQQELKAIHKKQFENMLKNDGATRGRAGEAVSSDGKRDIRSEARAGRGDGRERARQAG